MITAIKIISGIPNPSIAASAPMGRFGYLKDSGGLIPRHTINPSGQVRKHKNTIRSELLPLLRASWPTHTKLTTKAESSTIATTGNVTFIDIEDGKTNGAFA
jgi:hypothetical protein